MMGYNTKYKKKSRIQYFVGAAWPTQASPRDKNSENCVVFSKKWYKKPWTRKPSGFTMVESLVVVVVATILFFAVQVILSRGVRNTMKGQDSLETIRAASKLFSQIKRDLLACGEVKVKSIADASVFLGVGNSTIPSIPAASDEITFSQKMATITYKLETTTGGKKFVQRSIEEPTGVKFRDFGVPRMVSFKAQKIAKNQQIFPGGPFQVKQVRIDIELDSEDRRFPSRKLKLSSFFISSQMSASNWNYVY